MDEEVGRGRMGEVEVFEHCESGTRRRGERKRVEREGNGRERVEGRTGSQKESLLNIFLTEMSDVRLDDVEEFGDDCRDSSEETRTDFALPGNENQTTSKKSGPAPS